MRAEARRKVHGLFCKNAQAHWPFRKHRERSFDSLRNEGGGPRLEFALRERLVFENISLVGKLDFLPLFWPLPVLQFDFKNQ